MLHFNYSGKGRKMSPLNIIAQYYNSIEVVVPSLMAVTVPHRTRFVMLIILCLGELIFPKTTASTIKYKQESSYKRFIISRQAINLKHQTMSIFFWC